MIFSLERFIENEYRSWLFFKKSYITKDFPIFLNEDESLSMINFSMLQIPSMKKDNFIQLLFSLINLPFYMYIELNCSDEKDFSNLLIKNNKIFSKKKMTKKKVYFEVRIQKEKDFEQLMDEFIEQICRGNQVLFSTNNSNLQFDKKIDLVGFRKEESIYVNIEIKENSTVLFIGNDANELFLLSKEQQYENMNHFKKTLPSFLQYTHYDFDL